MKMTEAALSAHIEQLEAQAGNNETAAVANEQARAMDYYLQRPLGTEEEGRSQVISSDVWDVVEGMTPLVLKPFVASDDIVRFIPEGPEDEDAAEAESDYINYVVTQKNDVFETLITAVKTGLLQKNAVAKYWWETSKRKRIERYYGQSDDVYAALLQDKGVSVVEHTEYPGEMTQDPQTGEVVQGESTHDVVIRIEEDVGEAKYRVLPPEEFRISRNATSTNPKLAQFAQHVTRKTISAIREMGYDVPDDVADSSSEDPRFAQQYAARRNDYDQWSGDDAGNDPSMREVILRETYVNVDFDGDGIAELRKVCLVGDLVLENEEVEENPFVGWSPYPQPFRFDGRCPADEASEVQLIKTTILRQTLDNLYTINNNTRYVSDKVNLDDLLDNQIAGIVRVQGDVVGNHVMPAPVTPIGQITVPMIEYFDSVKENRTGFTRYNQGTDSNSLNKTATGVRIISEAGNERVGLISRCFAEQFLKPLMLGIHGLCQRHATKAEKVRLRGQWVDIDPRSWATRYDMSVSVGLGSADKQMQMQGAQLLIDTQLKLAPAGAVEPSNFYEAAAKLAQAIGEKNPDKYFTNPEKSQKPPPDPMQDPEFKMKIAEMHLREREVAIKERELTLKEQVAKSDAEEGRAELMIKAQAAQPVEQAPQADSSAFDAWKVQYERETQMLLEKMRGDQEERKLTLTLAAQHLNASPGDDGKDETPAEANGIADVAASIQAMAQAMMMPKRVIHDASGRPVGIEPVQ